MPGRTVQVREERGREGGRERGREGGRGREGASVCYFDSGTKKDLMEAGKAMCLVGKTYQFQSIIVSQPWVISQ